VNYKNINWADVSSSKVVKSLRMHEPFSNFIFIRNLWKNKLINADAATSEILSLTPSQYADKLDLLYPLN